MALNGFVRSCVKHSGGIVAIDLVEARHVTGFAGDADRFTDIVLAQGASFRRYSFVEGEADYEERLKRVEGRPESVEHVLKFAFGGMDGLSRRAAAELIEACRGGVVAKVFTKCGECLIVGCSREFGTERPLRLKALASATGRKNTEESRRTITLSSEDVALARPLV